MTGSRRKRVWTCGLLGSLLACRSARLDLGLLVGVYLAAGDWPRQFGRALLHPLLQKRRGLRLCRHVHDRKPMKPSSGREWMRMSEAHAVAPAEALLHASPRRTALNQPRDPGSAPFPGRESRGARHVRRCAERDFPFQKRKRHAEKLTEALVAYQQFAA